MFTRGGKKKASLHVHTEADSFPHPEVFLPKQVHTGPTQQVYKLKIPSPDERLQLENQLH